MLDRGYRGGLGGANADPALIALASRFDLLKPPERRRTLRRFRRIGTAVARWPAPYLLGSGVLAVVLLIALPGVPIGWNEAAATPVGLPPTSDIRPLIDTSRPMNCYPPSSPSRPITTFATRPV